MSLTPASMNQRIIDLERQVRDLHASMAGLRKPDAGFHQQVRVVKRLPGGGWAFASWDGEEFVARSESAQLEPLDMSGDESTVVLDRGRYVLIDAGGLGFYWTTAAIPAATKNASTGEISFGVANARKYDRDPDTGLLVDTEIDELIYNSVPKPIEINKLVTTHLWRGRPVVIVVPCGDFPTGSGYTSGYGSGHGGSGYDTGYDSGYGGS